MQLKHQWYEPWRIKVSEGTAGSGKPPLISSAFPTRPGNVFNLVKEVTRHLESPAWEKYFKPFNQRKMEELLHLEGTFKNAYPDGSYSRLIIGILFITNLDFQITIHQLLRQEELPRLKVMAKLNNFSKEFIWLLDIEEREDQAWRRRTEELRIAEIIFLSA